MDDLLPVDVWVLVCLHLRFDDATRLLSTLRGVDDDVYRALAVGLRGEAFWTRAHARRTRHVFTSMRDELRTIFLFEDHLRRERLPMWTDTDYYCWWDAEARYLRGSSPALPQLRLDGGKGARHGHTVGVRDGGAEVGHGVVVGLPRELGEGDGVLG